MSTQTTTTPAAATPGDAGPAAAAQLRLSTLTPAGRIAALTALRDALDERVKREKETLSAALAGATDNMPVPTPFGDLSFQPGKQPIKIDDEKLIEYVKTVAPEMVETQTIVTETIPDFYRETLVSDVIYLGEEVFARASSGEVINYAYLGTETASKISYPSSQQQKVVKAAARRVVRDNLEKLASPMLEVTDGRP